jgi:hypothetical protein
VEKEFGKIDKIECALEQEVKHLRENNSFESSVCLEDKYILSFKNGNKVLQPNLWEPENSDNGKFSFVKILKNVRKI